MGQSLSFVTIALGAALLGVVTRVAIPPLTWLALAALLHGTRSLMPPWTLVYVVVALYVALTIANRGIIPAEGPAYFVVCALIAATAALPFAVDRVLAPGSGPSRRR